MTDTANLGLPTIDAGQAQKHVTHNEALRIIDTLVQLAVIDRDLNAPPPSPGEGERWIVQASPSPTGAWAGHGDQIAAWQDGGWQFYAPKPGFLAYVADEGTICFWNGAAWASVDSAVSALQNLALLGVGTTADATNPFAAKLNNALWTAKTVAEGGDGNLRYKLSKESAAKTLSLLFQDNYSGRAEIGLTGDDDFHCKVSQDGSSWTDALVIDRTTGLAKTQGLVHAASNARANTLIFTPGGDGTVSLYRIDASCGQNPRSATIDSVSGDILTLNAAVANTFFTDSFMKNVSYLRIWNTSKTPAQSVWVKAQPAADQLQVVSAAAIAGWSNGEVIQAGDPTDVTPNRVIALDISPMMQTLFGAVFRQSGIMVKGSMGSATVLDSIGLSPSGVTGSFVAACTIYDTIGVNGHGTTMIPCTQASPISTSNLVFLREVIATTATTRLISSAALLV